LAQGASTVTNGTSIGDKLVGELHISPSTMWVDVIKVLKVEPDLLKVGNARLACLPLFIIDFFEYDFLPKLFLDDLGNLASCPPFSDDL
jgi:hypothetical protein